MSVGFSAHMRATIPWVVRWMPCRTLRYCLVLSVSACRAYPPTDSPARVVGSTTKPGPTAFRVPLSVSDETDKRATIPTLGAAAVDEVKRIHSLPRSEAYATFPQELRAEIPFEKFDRLLGNLERGLGRFVDARLAQHLTDRPLDRFIVVAFYERGARVFALDLDENDHLHRLVVRPLPESNAAPGPGPGLEYVAARPYLLPLRGEWQVSNAGPSEAANHHVGHTEQWYAVDLTRGVAQAPALMNIDYEAYGAPVMAPAGGIIATVVDGIPDNAPGERDDHFRFGNLIVIDHGSGEFSYLAHLQPGSIRVKPGMRVVGGRQLARVGNSGRSSEPHLHWHLASAAPPAWGHGLPIRLVALLVNGVLVEDPHPVRGDLLATP